VLQAVTGWLGDDATEWGGKPVARRACDAEPRRRAVVAGVVQSVVVHRAGRGYGRPGAGPQGVSFDACIDDGTGSILARWLGRTSVPGLVPGVQVCVEGTATEVAGRLVILNPLYRFESDGGAETS
jgi:hypothetical protein